MRTCTVEGCDKKHKGHGLCEMHYRRNYREQIPKSPIKTIKELFDESYMPIPEAGCWLWTGSFFKYGYGRININGKHFRAHRLSWIIHKGQIPEGMRVCHKCDTPSCVNPDHLFIGTDQDNYDDAVKKGRINKNFENNPNAKLTWEKVEKIRILCRQGVLQKNIGKLFDVTQTAISSIGTYRTWDNRKNKENNI